MQCLELLAVDVLVVVADLVDVLHHDDVHAGVVDGAAAGDEHGVVDGLVVAVGVGGDDHVLLLFVVAFFVLLRVRVADDDEVLHVAGRSVHGGATVLPRQRDDGGGPAGAGGGVLAAGEGGGEVVVELGHGVAHLGGHDVVGRRHCFFLCCVDFSCFGGELGVVSRSDDRCVEWCSMKASLDPDAHIYRTDTMQTPLEAQFEMLQGSVYEGGNLKLEHKRFDSSLEALPKPKACNCGMFSASPCMHMFLA